jgi:hypothetical protein
MRKIAVALALAFLGWAVFLITNTAADPNPRPATPPSSPESPYSTVCPPTETTTAVHPAIAPRRGAPCPEVTTTTIGGEGT